MKMKLVDISKKISKGSTPRGKVNYSKNEDNYFLRVTDMVDLANVYNSEFTLSNEDINKNKMKIWPINTVLVSIEGTVGKISILKKEMSFNQAVAGIIPNEEIINPRYLMYYLRTTPVFSGILKGTIMPALRLGDLSEIEIEVPNMKIQNKMVSIVDSITNKIDLNNKINNNLHDLAEQQFNEIYLKGSPKKLGELLVNISTGSRPKGGAQDCGVPSIGAEKIEKFGVYNYSSEKYISEEYYEKLKNGKLNSGDVLLYKDGAYTGKVSMCLNDFPHKKAAVNEHVFILNTKNNWAQNYLYFTLYNKDNKEMIHRLACSKAAQPGLNQIELKSVEVNICDEKEIINFENSVKPIMEKISSNTLENKKLVELRDTLLPKLMNGEIDLDNIEI